MVPASSSESGMTSGDDGRRPCRVGGVEIDEEVIVRLSGRSPLPFCEIDVGASCSRGLLEGQDMPLADGGERALLSEILRLDCEIFEVSPAGVVEGASSPMLIFVDFRVDFFPESLSSN